MCTQLRYVSPLTCLYLTKISSYELKKKKKNPEDTDIASHKITENRLYIFLFLNSILQNLSGIKYLIPVLPDIFVPLLLKSLPPEVKHTITEYISQCRIRRMCDWELTRPATESNFECIWRDLIKYWYIKGQQSQLCICRLRTNITSIPFSSPL